MAATNTLLPPLLVGGKPPISSHNHKEQVSYSVCGKVGHRQKQCWHRLGRGTDNSSQAPCPLICFLCGKNGHKSIACPDRSSNKAPGSKVIKKEFNGANTRRVVVVSPENWKRNVLKGSSQL